MIQPFFCFFFRVIKLALSFWGVTSFTVVVVVERFDW